MPYTPEEKKQVHLKMFGVEDIDSWIAENIEESKTGQEYSDNSSRLAMSLLSDAQELMLQGANGLARQYINRAKKLIRP